MRHEEFCDVPGLPGYLVSSDGRITGPRGHELKLQIDRKGYPRFHAGGAPRRHVLVSRCVALAYLGTPPTPAHEADHKNGDPTDNRVGNLYWATRSQNSLDAVRHGTHSGFGLVKENNPSAKLSTEEISDIRSEYAKGVITQRMLGGVYGVSQTNIGFIVRGETW